MRFIKDQEKFKRECYLINQLHKYVVERIRQAKSTQEITDLRKFHEDSLVILFSGHNTNKQTAQLKELAHAIFSPEDKIFKFLTNLTGARIAQKIYFTLGIFSKTARDISKRIDEPPGEALERGAGNKQ